MTGAQRKRHGTQSRRPTNAPRTARQLAFVVLDEYKSKSTFVAKLLDKFFSASDAAESQPVGQRPPAERRFASELVFGVVRRRLTLDALIIPHLRRPRDRIEGSLWTLLQMGTYQLVFMESVPSHAAVHETVELSRWLDRPRWSGYLNGILRSVERSLTDELVSEPASDAVPISDGRFRKINRNVFCENSQDRAGYMAGAFSLPRWLVERWQTRFDLDELIRLGFWFNAPRKLCLRVNQLNTNRDAVLTALAKAGVSARPARNTQAISLDEWIRVSSLPGFKEGWFTVQDESAISACELLAPQSEEAILDLCSAPGTKTTHLAELMQNRGQIIATDANCERLSLVQENSRRLGIDIIQTQPIRSDADQAPKGPFDAILVDVPCSNTGVLAKRPEARWRISAKSLAELVVIQTQLLATGVERLKPGGRIVYSTCSIEPEENQDVVGAIRDWRSDLELIDEIHHTPGRPADGGYQALLRLA